MKKCLSRKIVPFIIVGICLVYLGFVMFKYRNPFVSSYQIEAGQIITVDDLLKENIDAQLLTDISEINHQLGEHTLKAKAKGGTYNINLKVIDTVAPTAKVKESTIWIGDKLNAKNFVTDIKDETKVKVSFKSDIDTKKTGTQKVKISLIDEAGNETVYDTKVLIKKDTEGPVIKVASTITVELNNTPMYRRGVKIIDNKDGEIKDFTVDSTKVNPNKLGTYEVTYSAKDSSGNKTDKKVKVNIVSYSIANIKKQSDVYANKIISKIIKNGMSNQEKLKQIYEYVRVHYKYNGQHTGTINDYYYDAYVGFSTGRGDCYVVNAMARYLLEKVNIPTYGLVLNGIVMDHISFMADCGDGWYHYCAFKKKSGNRIYKYTDEQMVKYYNFDGVTEIPGNLPKTPKK